MKPGNESAFSDALAVDQTSVACYMGRAVAHIHTLQSQLAESDLTRGVELTKLLLTKLVQHGETKDSVISSTSAQLVRLLVLRAAVRHRVGSESGAIADCVEARRETRKQTNRLTLGRGGATIRGFGANDSHEGSLDSFDNLDFSSLDNNGSSSGGGSSSNSSSSSSSSTNNRNAEVSTTNVLYNPTLEELNGMIYKLKRRAQLRDFVAKCMLNQGKVVKPSKPFRPGRTGPKVRWMTDEERARRCECNCFALVCVCVCVFHSLSVS